MVALSNTADRPSVQFAGLFRRLMAWILDGVLILVIYGLVSGTAGWKILNDTGYPDELALTSLGVWLFLLLVDQIYLPVRFGTTITRWMMGYRIQKKEGGNPGWLRAFARVGGIYVLELLSLGIVTFISSVLRKDRAALHDLVSGTRAVLPERGWRRIPRLAAIVAIIGLCTLVTANFITYAVYELYVTRTKDALVEHGVPSRPAVYPNPASLVDGFSYHGIEFPLAKGITTQICEGEFDTYKPRKGHIDMALFHRSYAYFFPTYTVYKKDHLLADAAAMFLRAYPLNRPAHEIAAEVAHNERVEFPLLTPVDNTLRLYASLIYAIIAPSLVDKKGTFSAIQGEMTFGLYYGWLRERAAAITLFVVRDNHLEDYSLIIWGTPKDVARALETVIGGIRIIEDPQGQVPVLPPCSDISLKTIPIKTKTRSLN